MKKFLFLWGLLLAALGLSTEAHSQYLYRPTPYTYLFNTNATAAEARAYLGISAGGSFTNGTFVDGIFSGGSFSLLTNTDLTASRALVSDSAKRITNSTVTSTELGYLSGASSSIQTQLNAKGAATNGTFSGGSFTGATNTNIQIVGGTASQLAISGQAVVTSTNTGTTPFVVVGAAGQTANSFTIQTNGGTVQLLVTKEGSMGIGGSSTSYRLQLNGAGAYSSITGCTFGMYNTSAAQMWGWTAYDSSLYALNDITAAQAKLTFANGANGAIDLYSGTGYTTVNGTGGLKVVGKSYIGGTSTPQYQLDVNGMGRLIGTNGLNFGGTAGAADHTVTIHQASANVARITASTRTEITGSANVGSTGAGYGYFNVLAPNGANVAAYIANSAASPSVDQLQIATSGATVKFSVTKDFSLAQPGTITSPGTTGAQTINKPLGTVNLAAGATSLVVTDSVCLSATNCIVFGQVLSNDTTCKSVAIVVGTGQFTIYPDAAPTAETVVAFQVLKIQ